MRICLSLIIYIGFIVHPASCTYDFSELLPHDFQAEIEFGKSQGITSLPATASFQGNDYEVRYIASAHGSGIESPTCKMIDATINHFEPNLLILEGFDNTPEAIKRIMDIKDDELLHAEEPIYAVHLATLKNISFISGEPDTFSIIQALQTKQYTVKDIFYFYFMHQIPQFYRQGRMQTEDMLPNMFEFFLSAVSFEGKYTYEEYQNWLKEECGLELSFNQLIDTQVTKPLMGGNKVQRISYEIEELRDREILTRIIDAKKTYQKILVIYGSSHYYRQHKILGKYLGKPTYHPYEPKE